MKRKQELEEERVKLVERKCEIETRMTAIKCLAMQGKRLKNMTEQDATPVERLLQACLVELRAIRQAVQNEDGQ